MKRSILVIFIVSVSVSIVIAASEFSDPATAIKYRKSVMGLIGLNFGQIKDQIDSKEKLNRKAVVFNSKSLYALSKLPWKASLVPGSFSEDTTLSDKALTEKKKYLKAARAFEKQSKKLLWISRNGNKKRIGKQFLTTAGTCKNCHSYFRKK